VLCITSQHYFITPFLYRTLCVAYIELVALVMGVPVFIINSVAVKCSTFIIIARLLVDLAFIYYPTGFIT